MPGPKITDFLADQNYDNFYQQLHALVEDMGAALTYLVGWGQVIVRVLDMIGQGDDELRARAVHLHETGMRLGQSITDFIYFPTGQGQAAEEAYNQRRWYPYDGAAWDTLMDHLWAHIEGQLHDTEAALGAFQESMATANIQHPKSAVFHETPQGADEKLADLKLMLQDYEAFLSLYHTRMRDI